MSTGPPTDDPGGPARLYPVYAAGFVTAFGAHSIAASLGGYTRGEHASLLALGVLLAIYDGAEILLKPVFGALTDRIGARPVLLGGLVAFAAASAAFVAAGNPALVGLARLGQGAAAAAFSPAASTLVARLSPRAAQGRAFGGYGAFKSLGYTLGPLCGGALIALGGYRLLFAILTVLALAVAGAAAVLVPAVAPLPRARQTLLGLTRRLTQPGFLRPTATLAGATGLALAASIGFLPVLGAEHGLGPLVTGASVSLMALCAALVQPWAGHARDHDWISDRAGMGTGLALAATGLALATTLPAVAAVVVPAILVGAGTGLATPIGFAHLAATTDTARLGQTMGAAEVGREAGDAGGPLLVGAIASGGTLNLGLIGLAALLAATAAAITVRRRQITSE